MAEGANQAAQELFANMPVDPRQRLEAVATIYRALRHEAAEVLAPVITDLLRQATPLTYAEKSSLAHDINQVLADARLGIVDPQTKLPGTLLSSRPSAQRSHSYLRIRDSRAAQDGQKFIQHRPP